MLASASLVINEIQGCWGAVKWKLVNFNANDHSSNNDSNSFKGRILCNCRYTCLYYSGELARKC